MNLTRRPGAAAILASIALLLPAALLRAQTQTLPGPQDRPESVLPGRPDADVPVNHEGNLLGTRFESITAGISFRPPAGMKEIRRSVPSEIVRYVDDTRQWVLVVTKIDLTNPVPLSNTKTKDGAVIHGVIDRTVSNILQTNPGTEIFRQDQINIGAIDVGIVVARVRTGSETNLTQQAIVRRDDTSYYQLNLTMPAPRQGKVDADPAVQSAVAAFNAVVDSVKLLDQSAVRQDQDERLYRTRAFFVGLGGKRLDASLVHEQWLRIIQDGKDIGYDYVIEEPAQDLPRANNLSREVAGPDGILIGIRGRIFPRADMQADQLSWMWMSNDRKQERWSHIANTRKLGTTTNTSVVGNIGVVETISRHVRDPNLELGEKTKSGWEDKNQPPIREIEEENLTAMSPYGSSNESTVTRKLPVWYIPQALGYILPRLLVDSGARSFMFASWVPDQQEVMTRYVECLGEQDGDLLGKPVHGIVIQDRFGLEGSITTFFTSRDGTFLGSYNADSKLTVLPTDRDTLLKMWKDANLTRPDAVEATADTMKFTRLASPPQPLPGAASPGTTPESTPAASQH